MRANATIMLLMIIIEIGALIYCRAEIYTIITRYLSVRVLFFHILKDIKDALSLSCINKLIFQYHKFNYARNCHFAFVRVLKTHQSIFCV